MSNSVKVYVNVPFDEKEIAKERGARYDPNIKKWYFISFCKQFICFTRYSN